MRRYFWIVTVCAAVTLGMTARASEKPAEAYQQAMKDVGAANTALRADVKAVEAAGAYPDYMPIAADAAKLQAAFTVALDYWQKKKVDDAIELTQVELKHIGELEAARKDRNYDALMTAAADIGKTCGTCHTAHREKLADGSFEIK